MIRPNGRWPSGKEAIFRLGKKIKEGGYDTTKRARFEKKRVESRGGFLEDTLVSARLEQQWDEIMSGGCNRSTITTSFLCVYALCSSRIVPADSKIG